MKLLPHWLKSKRDNNVIIKVTRSMSRVLLLQIYLHWWGICPATWPARLSADSRTIGDQRVAQGWCGLASPRSGLAISSPCLTSTQSKAAYTNFAHCTCQFFPFANCYHDTYRLRPHRRYVNYGTCSKCITQPILFRHPNQWLSIPNQGPSHLTKSTGVQDTFDYQ